MSYKAAYEPSFLLCPESYRWISVDKALPKIRLNPYARLNDDLEDTGALWGENDEDVRVNR